MTSTRGQRLRDARRIKFRSARSAAISLGVAFATYGAHERAQSPGGRDYGPDAARRYARQFDVTPEWLLTGYATAHDSANIPKRLSTTKLRVVGYVGKAAQAHRYAVTLEDLKELEVSKLVTELTRVLEIRGNRMGSFYSDWLVLYDDLRETATPNLIGTLSRWSR